MSDIPALKQELHRAQKRPEKRLSRAAARALGGVWEQPDSLSLEKRLQEDLTAASQCP